MDLFFFDPLKLWTLIAALCVAVIVASILLFVALRYLVRRVCPCPWFGWRGSHPTRCARGGPRFRPSST
jgi:hypothetical protein